jgi:hypothetical protein
MFFYERRANRRINSDCVRLDAQSWLMSASITTALLLAFGIAWSLGSTRFAPFTVYADPVVLGCSPSAWCSCRSASCAPRSARSAALAHHRFHGRPALALAA